MAIQNSEQGDGVADEWMSGKKSTEKLSMRV